METGSEVQGPLRRLWRLLDRYWFGKSSYQDLAIVRIVVIGGHLLFFYPSLSRQIDYAQAPPDTFSALPALKVLLLPLGEWGIRPDPTLIHAVWIVGILTGIAALAGKYTRLSLFTHAAATTLIVAHYYSYGTVHHTRSLLVIALWALAFSPAGRVWSLDDLKQRVSDAVARGRFVEAGPGQAHGPMARWPLLLIQWTLALAYLSAGMSKLIYGGLDWFRPSTLTYYLTQDAVRQDAPFGLMLTGFPEFLTVIAVGTVVFELLFFLAVIVPHTAWLFVLMGCGMHLGILLTMGAPFLTWSLLYVAFLPSLRATVQSSTLMSALRRRTPPTRSEIWLVIYDGRCSLCIRSMTVLDYFDIGDRTEPVDFEREWDRVRTRAPSLTPEHALHAMQVLTPDGRRLEGFHAFQELTRIVPLLWPLAPVTHLPGANTIGPRVYEAVATERSRVGPCSTGACRVQSQSTTAF